ncbi:MAG: M24 family metallopeptidase [Desulfobacteraceae bacterium]
MAGLSQEHQGVLEGDLRNPVTTTAVAVSKAQSQNAVLKVPVASAKNPASAGPVIWPAPKKLGVEEGFLGLPPRKATFVGHGIGLDANEPPILAKDSNFSLSQDMVLTIEIHLTHLDLGVVKLEDMIRVTDSSCERSVSSRDLLEADNFLANTLPFCHLK